MLARGYWETTALRCKCSRPPEQGNKNWLVRFDHSLNKLSGVGTIPREGVIYPAIFKLRPDVNAVVHCHAAMCVALSLADQPIDWIHMQSSRFKGGTPIFPRPIYILDQSEGMALAETLGSASAVRQGPRHCDGRCDHRRGVHQCALHGAHGKNHGDHAAARLPGTDDGIDSNFERQQEEAFHSAQSQYASLR